jgi:hypothetical protein
MDFKTPNGQKFSGKRVFDKRKNVFLDVYVGKPTDFKSPTMVRQRLRLALLEKRRCLSEGAAGEIKAPKSTKNEE